MPLSVEALDSIGESGSNYRHEELLNRFNNYINQGATQPNEQATIPTDATISNKPIPAPPKPRPSFMEGLSKSDMGFLSRNPNSRNLYEAVQSQGLTDSLESGDTNKFLQQAVLSGIPISTAIDKVENYNAGKQTSTFLNSLDPNLSRDEAEMALSKAISGYSSTVQQKIRTNAAPFILNLKQRKELDAEKSAIEVGDFNLLVRTGGKNGGVMTVKEAEVAGANLIVNSEKLTKEDRLGVYSVINRIKKEEDDAKLEAHRNKQASEDRTDYNDKYYKNEIADRKNRLSNLKSQLSAVYRGDDKDIDPTVLADISSKMDKIKDKAGATSKKDMAKLMNDPNYAKLYSQKKALTDKQQLADHNRLEANRLTTEINNLGNEIITASRDYSDFLKKKGGVVIPQKKSKKGKEAHVVDFSGYQGGF